MHKHIAPTLFLLLIALFANAQSDLDSKLLRQTPNCESVAYNSTRLINQYFAKQQLDSLSLVLSKWEDFCGETEPIFRAKILLGITNNNFSEETILPNQHPINMVMQYSDRKYLSAQSNYRETYEYYKVYLNYVPLNSDFDLTTIAWANSLLEENADLTPVEKAYCLLYANQTDNFWDFLKSESMNGTELQQNYRDEVKRTERMWEGNVSFLTGAFLPSGNLNHYIGPKAIFGLQLGAKYKKMQYDLTLAFRPGAAQNYYQVNYQNQLIDSKDHFSGYIGLDFARELTNNFKRELDLEWGIGADVMDVVNTDINSEEGKSIGTLNLNIGLGYRFYLKNMNYVGIHAKYNKINYNNDGGTDLSGDYTSLTLSYHFFGNPQKNRTLKTMQLK